MIVLKELGIFKNNREKKTFVPIEFDWSGRQLWLHKIQCCDYREIGSGNYSYDQLGTYNFIFHINSGDNIESYIASEDYVFIVQIEISEWYRPEKMVADELFESFRKYPILDLHIVLEAFRQRKYYRIGNYKIEDRL